MLPLLFDFQCFLGLDLPAIVGIRPESLHVDCTVLSGSFLFGDYNLDLLRRQFRRRGEHVGNQFECCANSCRKSSQYLAARTDERCGGRFIASKLFPKPRLPFAFQKADPIEIAEGLPLDIQGLGAVLEHLLGASMPCNCVRSSFAKNLSVSARLSPVVC